ncbi:hypothetical protein [Paenibacillus assamensis]|uniref:hypothetical protein n=1 Tax=Paenibacillus assamensis TaxID=311244 RepID=UPI000428C700|nr:hypothetical protein [Paenibacillus assamensis]
MTAASLDSDPDIGSAAETAVLDFLSVEIAVVLVIAPDLVAAGFALVLETALLLETVADYAAVLEAAPDFVTVVQFAADPEMAPDFVTALGFDAVPVVLATPTAILV